jgi:hypothetical protein
MALIIPILGELSGKLGGNVFARNKGGSYVRGWVKPTNPKTGAQMAVRSAFSSAATAWQNLSDEQKSAWNQYALNYFKPRVLKPRATYSGFQAFVSLRNAALQAQRLTRHGKITAPTSTITQTVFAPELDPPTGIFQGNLQTSDHIPLNQTLGLVSFAAADAHLTAKMLLSGPTGATSPIWKDPDQGTPFGYVFFASARNNSSQLYQQCIGAFKHVATAGTWGDCSEIEYEFDLADLDTANRKLWYSVYDKIKISCFALSTRGESALIGQSPVMVE